MITSKKYFLMITLIILCAIQAAAQTGYYYKGKIIPLVINENKIGICIPKGNEKVSETVLENTKVYNKISDDNYDLFFISKRDYERLTSLDSWKEFDKSIIRFNSYFTKDKAEVFSTPYINIRLRQEQDINLLTSYADKYGLKIVKQVPLLPLWYILEITTKSELNPLECANKIWESGMFAASVPDFSAENIECSNDPMFNQQWGLYNSTHAGIDISVTSAWNYSTGKNIKIAFVDSGVDLNHIDLSANINSMSYDTETNSSPSSVYSNHGTHCAGIAAAIKDNGIHIAGVAPDATIISTSTIMFTSTSTPSKLASGIVWAYQHGADIISNSWYYPSHHEIIDEAIDDAFTYGRNGKGCIIVFSAGNQDSCNVVYPANCNEMILAVGAINNTGMRASFSNRGDKLDLVAPGVGILSTIPNDTTLYKTGTSMACPHVAGVAALILERNSELSVNQVNSIICANTKKIPGVSFDTIRTDGTWNNEYGYGLVDAYSAVINTPNTIYIQNETITGTRVFSANNIYVGKDVTDTKEYGDVTLGPGNITLKAEYTEIKNSTTVPLGTTLNIGPND